MRDEADLEAPAPPDPVIEGYKRDVDRTLIRENLRRTHEERVIALAKMIELVTEVQQAGKALRRQ